MGLFSSSGKKISNVKFFFILLFVSAAIAIAAGFLLSDEEALVVGLLISFFGSVIITLFRILKNSNDPDNRVGNWRYFFTLLLFTAGLLAFLSYAISQDEEAIVLAIIASFVISSIVSIGRSIKHWRQEKKAEKERKQQYQERLQRENRQYADELAKKDRIIRDLQSRNSELQQSQRTVYSPSPSTSRYRDNFAEQQREREREKQRQEDEKKKQRLEDWYREYVTIEVSFDYHIKDSEYNQDYWDHRSEDIRVTRREAMALIQAGEGALLGRLGYTNRGNIRNVGYKTPYGLYDRPWNC